MRIGSFFCLGMAFFSSGCSTVSPFQPNVPQGGRAVAIAVNPTNAQAIMVASETGGLFSSSDGGNTWQHADGLPNFGVNDVAFAPQSAGSNIVVATAGADFAANNNGFIWRSTDRGNTWSQPAGSLPTPNPPACPNRANAYGLSFEPNTAKVYVATDCGLAVSRDAGATWNPIIVVDQNASQHKVNAVLALPGGRLEVSTATGLFSSPDAGQTWIPAASGAPGFQGSNHSFAASPYNSDHVFFTGGSYQVFLTTDPANQHQRWTSVAAPQGSSRAPFVRTAQTFAGLPNQFDLYYGDGDGPGFNNQCLWRQTFTEVAAGLVGTGNWTLLGVDHCDTNDVAFDSASTPVLLATDGGVHKTPNRGANWQLTGGGPGGFNALQLTEVTGQFVGGLPFLCPKLWDWRVFGCRLDLYYGTQDNDDVASGDSGRTWPAHICCEGFSLQTPSANTPAATNYTVTGVAIGDGCGMFSSGPVFANCVGWQNPPTGNPQTEPYYFLSQNSYLEETTDSAGSTTFWLTNSTGSSWSSTFTIQPQVVGRHPFMAGPSSNPTVYEAVLRPGSTPDGQQVVGVNKAMNLLGPGPATVSIADGSPQAPLGSLGAFSTMFTWYWLFAVDLNNPNHLIAADIESNQMKFSPDGGQNWFPDASLTGLVTNQGVFDFREGQGTLAHAIAFDPYDSCHILVGTAQNGVIHSIDGANSWQKIKGSEVIANLSSFYFPPDGPIVVSTYGRGLWKLNLSRRNGPCTFKAAPPPLSFKQIIVTPSTGARVQVQNFDKSTICPRCMYVIVMNGAITDVKVKDGKILEISMSGGSIHEFDANKKEVPLQIPNAYSSVGTSVSPELQAMLKDKAPIRGLVVEGQVLKGIIASQAQLPFQPVRIPSIHVLTSQSRGIPATEPGGKVTVLGEGFAPSAHGENPLQVRFAEETVSKGGVVAKDGTFRVEFEVKQMPGDYGLVVEQKEGKRTSLERMYIKVITGDRSKEK
jgi:photosystem II stability/assembly factor-like uncharacterized protein